MIKRRPQERKEAVEFNVYINKINSIILLITIVITFQNAEKRLKELVIDIIT